MTDRPEAKSRSLAPEAAPGQQAASPSRALRVVLLVGAVALAAFYISSALRVYRAAQYAQDVTPEKLGKAAQLQPGDADLRYRLARYSLVMQDFPAAIQDIQAAIVLNPYDARFWLDLANVRLATGDVEGEQQALAKAVEADPTTPEVIWQTANYDLVQGNTASAMHRLHTLLEHNAESLEPVLNVSWRATRDPVAIARDVLPQRPEVQFRFLQFLLAKGQPQSAAKVWSHLISIKQPFPVQLAFPYFDYLLGTGHFVEMNADWIRLAEVNPQFRQYLPDDNLIVNGGFELDLLNGGRDWRYAQKPGVSPVIDVRRSHSGNRSLSFSFEGAPDDAGLYQFIPVQANARYEFSGYMMSEDLETTSPPRFSIVGMQTNATYLLSDGLQDSSDWREFRGDVVTGPSDDLLLLRIIRMPSQKLIRGKIWVDDLSLVRKR